MSFGYCVADVLALIQLSWSAVEGARKACGKHDDLTGEVSSLYDVLAHVYSEMSAAEPSIGQARKSMRTELEHNLRGCEQQLRIINTVLNKFNALNPSQRAGKTLWSKIQFANGRDQDVAIIRSRMAHYSMAISMSLHLIALRSRGKIERQLSHQKSPLNGLRESINFALAYLNSTTKHNSLVLAHSNDAKRFWRSLRHEIVNDGFKKDAVQGKKNLIISYMKELDSRGVLGHSASFQKSLIKEKEHRQSSRESSTQGSSRSHPTFPEGRTSNTFDSYTPAKFCNSPTQCFDEAACLRTPTWSEASGSVTIFSTEKSHMVRSNVIEAEDDDEGYSGSPKASIIHRFPNVSSNERPQTPPTPYDEGIDMLPGLEPSTPCPNRRFPRQASAASMSEQKIKFEDPNGREFAFPLAQAKTWEGMEELMRKNCAGASKIHTETDGSNILPYLWDEIASPGAKITIRRPEPLSQPYMYIAPSKELFLLPEKPASPEEEEYQKLPTLGEWISRGRTEFTPHSEFVEMD